MNKIALACEMSLNDWSATFPSVIPEPEYSKKYEKWRKKLFDKMRDDYYHRFTTRTIKVMLVAATITVLLLTAFVIPSSREFILDKFDEFSAYQLTESNDNSVAGEITVGYVPEGYELTETIDMNKYKKGKYTHSNGNFFTVIKYSSAVKIDFNTEFSPTEEIVIDNIKYVYCKGNLGVDNIIWTSNDYVYRISGSFTFDELLKIAKKVN